MTVPFTPTSPHKKVALILGATGNLTFALGVVLLGLKRHNARLLEQADVIVYYQNMDETCRRALNNVLPCRFTEYHFPNMQNMQAHVLRDYGEMSFARYESFRYLKTYDFVLWLDADVLVQGDLSGLFTQIPHGIGFRREYYGETVRQSFTKDIPGFDMQQPHFNSGIMAASNQLPADKNQLSDWCYQKTAEIAEELYYPDQGILLLMCQHFGLTIDPLDEKYNCEARRSRRALSRAAIVHAVGHRKFWKYYYFDEWFQLYKEWVRKTGLPCSNHFPLLKRLGLLKFPLFQVAPNPTRYPIKFITYLLRACLRLRY